MKRENDIKVSVIITTHNRPELLQKALLSVFEQDYLNYEILVINDSPNNSEVERIVKSFNDPRVIYHANEINLGSAKSLNIGLARAKGEYVAILDDDDEWIDKAKLTKQVYFLDDNPDFVLVSTNVEVVDYQTEEIIVITNYDMEIKKKSDKIFTKNCFAHSSILVRMKALIDSGGYDENLTRAKDYDLLIKLSKLGSLKILKEVAVRYREKTNLYDRFQIRKKDSKYMIIMLWRHKSFSFNYVISLIRVVFRCIKFHSLPTWIIIINKKWGASK